MKKILKVFKWLLTSLLLANFVVPTIAYCERLTEDAKAMGYLQMNMGQIIIFVTNRISNDVSNYFKRLGR